LFLVATTQKTKPTRIALLFLILKRFELCD